MNEYIGLFDTDYKCVPKENELSYGAFLSALCKIAVLGRDRLDKAAENIEKWY